MYEGLTTKVKWMGGLSDSFQVKQGVRQGGVLSTHLYKLFVQDLLLELEHNAIGLHLGNIYVGTPTCADDVAFLESDRDKLQIMLNIISRYAKQHHYNIHPTKTKILDSEKSQAKYSWFLDGNEITASDQATHLGLIRSGNKEGEINVNERIKIARRTKYALLGTGMHGSNGIDAHTSYKIYKTYVLPRLLYGLEVIFLNKSNIQTLELFHRKSLRTIQSLPQRTANAAVYSLIGALPLEAELHLRQLSFLYSVLTCENKKMAEIIKRQMSVNYNNTESFFYNIRLILQKYKLPPVHLIQQKFPTKERWKVVIKQQVFNLWKKLLTEELSLKSSLNYMCKESIKIGQCHPVWNLQIKRRHDVRKSIIKVRIITGTFILQCHKNKFTPFQVSALCPLCETDMENIQHFLLKCPALASIQEKYIMEIKRLIRNMSKINTWERTFNNADNITKLIIDCQNFAAILCDETEIQRMENITKDMCYELYMERLRILEMIDTSASSSSK